MDSRPDYAIVVVAYKSRALLARMFARIPATTRVIVADNSADVQDLTDLIGARPHTTYVDTGGNVGFGAACNLAARAASEPFIVFVNPDADVEPAVLDSLAHELARNRQCASCGPMLEDDKGRVRTGSGGWLPTPRRAVVHALGLFRLLPKSGIGVGPLTDAVLPVEWVAGTCLMVRRSVFLEMGGFSPRYFLYQEDMDLGRRLRASGWRQILRGDLRVRHLAGTSSDREDVSHLAWRRASALVDYLAATQGTQTARLICGILACGMTLRAGYALVGLRRARLKEFAVHIRALARPRRTLQAVEAERRARVAGPVKTAAERLVTSANA